MGSWMDLKPEQNREYNDLLTLYKSSKPYVSPLETAVMVDLYKQHGYAVMQDTLVQCGLNGWSKVDKVKLLAGLFNKYGKVKTEWAIERANAMEFHSLDTVAGILAGSIPAYRKGSKDGKPETVAKTKPKYPTEDGYHTRGTAQQWLSTHGHSLEQGMEFFEIAGRDPEHNFELYRLKPEYAC